jgi:UTP--glucose-1-phosphate uridylyltransferase
MKIKKAIIPAAGIGTRFLPATIAQPKEMLVVVDKPVIQYVVEEAVNSGIDEILIVTGRSKRAVEDHFDPSEELEIVLEQKGKDDLLKAVRDVSNLAKIHFVRQKRQRGLADAIYQGKDFVGKEPFAVLLGDTIIDPHGEKPCLYDMVKIFEATGKSIVSVEELADPKLVERYGIIKPGEEKRINGVRYYDVLGLVEKPSVAAAPSRMAIASRYIFNHEIFDHIEKTKPGKSGEIQITDSMKALAKDRTLLASIMRGTRYDIGNKVDFIKTNIDLALKRKGIRESVLEFIREKVKENE